MQIVFWAQALYNLNTILIRFLQSKLISNSFLMKPNSFLRANDSYLELCIIYLNINIERLIWFWYTNIMTHINSFQNKYNNSWVVNR